MLGAKMRNDIDRSPRVFISNRSSDRPELELKVGDKISVNLGETEQHTITGIEYVDGSGPEFDYIELDNGVQIKPDQYSIINSIELSTSGGRKSRRRKSRRTRKSRRY